MAPSLHASDTSFPLKALFFVLSVAVTGCSSSQTGNLPHQTTLNRDVAPGVILVDVLEGGRSERYWQYEIQPTAGVVREAKQERFQDSAHEDFPHVIQQPSGAIETCTKTPEANSPDQNYSAYCTHFNSDEFFVIDRKTKETLYQWKPEEWRGISGFVWVPNSRSVAFLNVSSHYGKGPLELISALSGHPVPHDTVFLDVVDVRTARVVEYVVRRNVVSSFTRILKWSE